MATTEFRTSDSCNVDPQNETVKRVESKITALMGIDAAHGETIQGQRYGVGQQFKPHYDFFHQGEAYWDEMMRSGGQRTWTAMVFLNDVEGGGETNFTNAAGEGDAPARQSALLEQYGRRSASPISYAMHQGCRSPRAPNISSPNGTASGPGPIPAPCAY